MASRGDAVADYRLYFMDRSDHIARALALQCEDDEEALRVVAGHRHQHAMELWQGARRVSRIEPNPL